MAIETFSLDELGIATIEAENASIDDIDAEAIDLIFTGIDESGSMTSYITDMTTALSDFKISMQNSKESEHILIARANFYDDIDISGYLPIDEFDTGYSTFGATLLYDVICDGSEKMKNYIKYLKSNGMRVKAVFAIFSDGEDNGSISSMSNAARAIEELNKLEFPTAFIAFGQEAKNEAARLGFRHVIDIVNAQDPGKELRKAFNRLSKSIIEHSKKDTGTTDAFFI